MSKIINFVKSSLSNELSPILNREVKKNNKIDFLEQKMMSDYSESLISDSGKIVISLTTYSHRIHDVAYTIESLGYQTVKPKKIILWLDEEEFNNENLTMFIKKQILRGLEVKYCSNIKSYKKLIPTLRLDLGMDIITVDDDYIYPVDFIEVLNNTSVKYPNVIISNLAHGINYDKDHRPLPYKKWDLYGTYLEPSMSVFPVGAGGVYYPINTLSKFTLEEDLFLKLAPNGDDIWFKYMSLLNEIPCMTSLSPKDYKNEFILLEKNQDIGLFHLNLFGNENDKQIYNVHDWYLSIR